MSDPDSTVPPRPRDARPAPPNKPAPRAGQVVAGASDLLGARALPAPGERVGPCEVVRELARGGMGAVFVAKDPAGREVALKVLLGGTSTAAARFEVEGRATAMLLHPGIVAVHTLGVDQGRAYLVMDLVPGESMQARIERDGPLPPAEAVRLVRDVALAVEHAHSQGVLHRDIKPHNVIVTPDGRAVVTDFGLAKVIDQQQSLTRTGATLGTPAYMPPEQARGDRAQFGPASDVYSLGATLYALLAGDPPFEGLSAIELLVAVLHTPPEPPSRARPELDPRLDAITLRCLAKDPAERYPSAGALAADLDAWLAGGARSGGPRASWVLPALAVVASAGALALALVFRAASSPSGATAPTPPAPAPAVAPPPPAAIDWPPGPTPITADTALDLQLQADGTLDLEVEVASDHAALVLVLRADAGAWSLVLDDAADPDRHRAPAGEGEVVLAAVRDAAPALRAGRQRLRVTGPPGGHARLSARLLGPGAPLGLEPLEDEVPLPPLEECFSPENLEDARQLVLVFQEWRPATAESRSTRGPRDTALQRARGALTALARQEPRPQARLFAAIQCVVGPEAAVEDRWRDAAPLLAEAAAAASDGGLSLEYARGRAELARKRPGEALAPLARAIAAGPRWVEPRLALARAMRELERLGEAADVLQGVLAREPGQLEATAALADVELSLEAPPWARATDRALFAVSRSEVGFHRVNALARLLTRIRQAGPLEAAAARASAARVLALLEPYDRATLGDAFRVEPLGRDRLAMLRGIARVWSGDVAGGLAELEALDRALEREGMAPGTVPRPSLREALAAARALPR